MTRTARVAIIMSGVAAMDGFALWWAWLAQGWLGVAQAGVGMAFITTMALVFAWMGLTP